MCRMAEPVDDRILGALDNLSAEQLDLFKHKLSTLHKIGYGLIEKESKIAIVKRIINKFTKEQAIARTAVVLRAIDQRDLANSLENEATAGWGASSAAEAGGGASASGASASSTARTEGKHFVDKHQVELIDKIKLVKPILDRLLQREVIIQEMCDAIAAEKTPYNQMRKLMHDVIFPGDDRAKDELFTILEEREYFLVQNLKGK